MRRFLVLSLILLLAWGLFAQEQAILRDFTGKVEVQPPGKTWEPAARNLVIPQGATISTGFNSYATVVMGSSTVQIKPLTRMTLAELTKQEGVANTTLSLRVGRVNAKVEKVEGLEHNFTLKSPVSTAAVRGTEFDFDSVRLKVIEGLVAYSNAVGQSRAVAGGEESSISGYSAPKGAEQALIAAATTTITTSPAVSPVAGPKQSKPKLGGTITVTVQ